MPYPDASDLRDRIEGCGAWKAGALDGLPLTEKAAAAAADWERKTGWRPFLSSGSATARTFDPPRGTLLLPLSAGLLSLTSLTVSDSAYTAGTDFFLEPANAVDEERPYTCVRFRTPVNGAPEAIEITGQWGYAADLPDGAREAILARALSLCYPDLALLISRGLYSARDLNFEIRYGGAGITPLSQEKAAWDQTFKEAVRSFKRISV